MKLTKSLFAIIAGLIVSLTGLLQAQVTPGSVSISGGPPSSPQNFGKTNSVGYTATFGKLSDNGCEALTPSSTNVVWGATCGSFISTTNNPATWTNVFIYAGWYTNVITCTATFKGTDCNGTNYSVSTNACVTNVINVIQLTNQCVATTPTNQSRTNIGVGEQVFIWILGSPTGAITWSTSAGSVGPTSGTSTTLTAPGNAATATVKASYSGGSLSAVFSVIEPTGVNMVVYAKRHSANRPDIGINNLIYLAPDSVNFGAVWCQEEMVNEVATGVYSFMNGQPHESAPTPFPFTATVVPGLGTSAGSVNDHVYSGDPGTAAPFAPGTETVIIPWDFQEGINPWKNFTTLTHLCVLGAGGALSASKGGASWSCNVTNATVP